MGIGLGSPLNDLRFADTSRELTTAEPSGPRQESPVHLGPTDGGPGDAVSLNPQPLPPRNLFTQPEGLHAGDPNTAGAERGIIIVGGNPGDAVSLNPQPLPPRNAGDPSAAGAERGIIFVGGNPGDKVSLNPQPLPPRNAVDPNTAGAERGIIIIGGHGQENPELSRGIIVIGGKLRG